MISTAPGWAFFGYPTRLTDHYIRGMAFLSLSVIMHVPSIVSWKKPCRRKISHFWESTFLLFFPINAALHQGHWNCFIGCSAYHELEAAIKKKRFDRSKSSSGASRAGACREENSWHYFFKCKVNCAPTIKSIWTKWHFSHKRHFSPAEIWGTFFVTRSRQRKPNLAQAPDTTKHARQALVRFV